MTTSSICTRSIAAVVALSFTAFAVPTATAQTTATTIPVGFITKTAPAMGASPTNTPLSVPLYQTADFQSSVASTPTAGSHDITLTGAAFASLTTTPHLIRVKTGSLTGRFWLILSNTATTVTTKEPNGGAIGVPDGDLTGLVAGDSSEILPANTLASVFGNPPVAGLGTGASASTAGVDNVLIWNGVNFDTYFNNGTNWKKGSITSNNVVLYPDDSVFFVRKVASDLPITFMGTVPSTPEKTQLFTSAGNVTNNFVSNRFPVDLTLGTSQIEQTPGWVKNTSANTSDTVLLWNGNSWDTYFFNSTSNVWKKGSITSTGTPISAATGIFIVRLATPVPTVSEWSQILPYTIN